MMNHPHSTRGLDVAMQPGMSDSSQSLQAVVHDAMHRIYPDRWEEAATDDIHAQAVATGHTAAVVVAVRCPQAATIRVELESWVSPAHQVFTQADLPADAPQVRIHWLAPVHVQANSVKSCHNGPWQQDKADYLLRPAPFDVCEVLWPEDHVQSPGGRTEGFVVLIDVPPDALVGRWCQRLRITAGDQSITCQTRLNIQAVNLPAQDSLRLVNWLRVDRLAWQYPDVKPWSDEHWRIIQQALALLKNAGQNIVYLPIIENSGNLIDAWQDENKTYHFNFDRFDKMAQMALELGYTHLLGAHVGGKKKIPHGDDISCDLREPLLHIRIPGIGGYELGPQMPACDPEARRYLTAFFTALRQHLQEKGWLDIYMQNIGDEPFQAVSESYCRTTEFIRDIFPGVPLIDAASTHGAAHVLDIPVPEIDYLEIYKSFYDRLISRGKEVWLYVCCCPADHWPNRFLDFHLNRGAMLPWFCFHYDTNGFLHWGAAQWQKDTSPFQDSGFQGDGFVLYPGPQGPVGSMRLLAQQLGVQDHQLLSLLAHSSAQGRGEAKAICQQLIRSPADYDYHCVAVQAARDRLLQAVSRPSLPSG